MSSEDIRSRPPGFIELMFIFRVQFTYKTLQNSTKLRKIFYITKESRSLRSYLSVAGILNLWVGRRDDGVS